MLPRRSKFVFGGITWETSLPAHPWTPADSTFGGERRITATGIPAVDLVRRDDLIDLVLRVREREWTQLLALITFGQSAETFLWYPDADLPGLVTVWLESPVAGEEWGPTRSDYPRVFEVTLTLRAALSFTTWSEYFEGFAVPVSGGGVSSEGPIGEGGIGSGEGGGVGSGEGDLLNVTFDDGSFGPLAPWVTWPIGSTPATIVADATAIGGKSVRMSWVGGDNNNKGVLVTVPGGPRQKIHVRFRYKLPAGANISGIMKLIRFRGPADKAIGTIDIFGGQWLHWTDDLTDGANHFASGSTPADALDTWIWVEAMADWSAFTSGVFRLWIDGELVLDYTRSGVSYSGGIQTIYLWGYFNSPAETRNEWIDQVAVGTSYIGIP